MVCAIEAQEYHGQTHLRTKPLTDFETGALLINLTKYDQMSMMIRTRPSALGMSDPVLEFLEISKNYNQFSFLEHVYVALMMH